MKEAIESRELFVLDGLDVVLRGTYHKPPCDNSSEQPNEKADRIGVLFVSSLFPTRAGNGDSAVYWADSLASDGYPSFRLDCPGFGDSGGDPPPGLFEFINCGGYAPILSAKIKELMARFHLSGVVVVGLCSGAVSAIWTAATSEDCKGLILMNPYFHVPPAVRPNIREKLSAWSLKTRSGGMLSRFYALLKELRQFLRQKTLPKNANHGLLRRFKELASAGMPVLILNRKDRKAPGLKSRVGEFDYLGYVLESAGRKRQVVVRIVEGADHSLSNRLGRLGAKEHAEQWLKARFPLTERQDTIMRTSLRNPGDSQNDCRLREQVLNCN